MAKEDKGGGLESTILSTFDATIERAIASMVDHVSEWAPIKAMIADLSPKMKTAIYHGLPSSTGLLIDRIPNSMFKTPERGEFVKDTVREVAKRISDAVNAGVTDPEEARRLVDEAVQSVKDRVLVIDNQLNLAHHGGCFELQRIFLPKGKKHSELKYEAAIERGVKFCPHCFPKIQQELQKPAEEPKKQSPRKNLSPMDIMGMVDKKERAAFSRWINSKTPEERKALFDSLQELDSIEEFRGLMSLSPRIRDEAVHLLKNRNAKHWLKGLLGTIGTCLKFGYEKILAALQVAYGWIRELWESIRQFDRSFAPLVQEQRARQQDVRDRRQKPVPFSLKNLLLPF